MKTNNNKYKKTKVGWIPKEWEVKRLGENELIFKGKGISKKELKPSGIPCITYGDIYTKYNTFTDRFEKYIDQNSADNSILIQKGDVLFAGSGETQEDIGKSIVYTGSSIAYAGGDIIILRQNKADYIFLAYLLNSIVIMKQFFEMAQGNSVVHIYSKNVNSLSIPLPPMREQKRIAEILSTWDEAIETTEKLIAVQEQRKKWLMQQLLTGKTRFSGDWSSENKNDYKKTKVGWIPNDWVISKMKEVVLVDSESINQYYNKEIKFNYISLSDVQFGNIADNLKSYNLKDAPSRARRIVRENDVLLSTVRPNLKGFLFIGANLDSFIASTGFSVLRSNGRIEPKYLYAYIFSYPFEKQIEALLVGSNYPAINSSEVKSLSIPLPSLPEQIKIAEVISTQGELIEGLQDEKRRLVEQKRGLMQVLLTGAVRV